MAGIILPIDIMLPEFADQHISWHTKVLLKLLCVMSFMVDCQNLSCLGDCWCVCEQSENRISVNSVILCLTLDSVFMGQFSTLIAEIIGP